MKTAILVAISAAILGALTAATIITLTLNVVTEEPGKTKPLVRAKKTLVKESERPYYFDHGSQLFHLDHDR